MSSIISENAFETAIIQSLIENGGYTEGTASNYSPELGLFRDEVLQFLQETQAKQWEKLSAIHGSDVENRIIQRLYKEMDLRSSLNVIRNGFVDYGVRFKMAFFMPASGLNPDTIALYKQNRLKVIRQVYYSKKNKNSVDLVLSLNGVPVATLELKNQFTGQNVAHAKKQYVTTRDNKELLFAFKKRTLIHFAVDDEAVYMSTRIEGGRTHWLPFNQGDNFGAGNPLNPTGYKTDYLWRDILAKDSWLEIIGRFIHLQIEAFGFEGHTRKKETMIFPRFHQLDAVRKITGHAQENGVGCHYLVQHSAGSGKSNTIAWLAYRLSGLHNANDQRIFDSVIVVTDRRVLDSQLQNTIYQFEHKSGVVQRIDKDSSQLADAIVGGANIIITTLQKFPFVIDKVGALPNRTYAVIVDEAHSSQGGEASKKLKAVLSSNDCPETAADATEIEEPYPTYGDDDGEVVDSQEFINYYIERSAAACGRQNNLSFFAFTAMPKYKTLAVFGYKDGDGKPQPFHLYSMRQAIEEGFILDVLQNYVPIRCISSSQNPLQKTPELTKRRRHRRSGVLSPRIRIIWHKKQKLSLSIFVRLSSARLAAEPRRCW